MARRKTVKPAKSPRLKAQQTRSKETVQRILDSAMALTAEKGEAVTMSEIATRSGVVIGALYRYFADKRAINRAILQQHFVQTEEMLRERLGPAESLDTFIATVQSAYELYFEMHQRDPLYRNLWSVVQTDSELQAMDVADSLNNARLLVGIAEPLFTGVDREELMAACVFLMHFAASSSRLALALPKPLGQKMRPLYQDIIADTLRRLGCQSSE